MLKPKTFVVAVAANLIAGVFAHPAAIPTTTLDLYATTPNPDLIPPNPTLIPPTPVGTHSVVFDTSEGFVPATASLPVIRRDESETSAGNSTLLSSDSSSSSSAVALEQRKVRHYLKVNCKQICDPWGEFYNQRVCEHPGCKTQEHDKKEKLNGEQRLFFMTVYFPEEVLINHRKVGSENQKHLNEWILAQEGGRYRNLLAH